MAVLVTNQAQSEPPGFADFLEQIRAEAIASGMPEASVSPALASAVFLDRVVYLDQRQPEFTQTFWRYLETRISAARIDQGRSLLVAYQPLLDDIYSRYGVPPQMLVALWGMESDYGRIQGDFSCVSALSTLAFDSRRSSFFRQQLMALLQLIARGDVETYAQCSWAGAVGQPQFIPTTFRDYAVDFDGDGRRDLFYDVPDVLASAASYLSARGWDPQGSWGHEVMLPTGFDYAETGLDVQKTLTQWRALGVSQPNGEPLPSRDLMASILLPAGASGPAFMVYKNFRVILAWNNSILYALAVGHLSDRLAGAGPLWAQRPMVDPDPLSRQDVVTIQVLLSQLGYETGEPDGLIGPKTQRAIRAYQKDASLPADGFPDAALLALLRSRVPQGGG